MQIIKQALFISLLFLSSVVLNAESDSQNTEYLGLFTPEQTSFIVGSGVNAIEIKRTMTSCAKNKGFFQPFIPAKGINPVTEAEMLNALNDKEAVIVDMRMENWYENETIPTAINIPYSEIEVRLDELGCKQEGDNWDCSKAIKVYGFCNGPVCAQSPVGMKAMIRNGFPAEKIYYYRGGMLDWTALGLTTIKGEF
ncbi:rhodanese-like domain-containing protein [Candidatus Sulfurimonas marisnigri]|uniref:Rhodanese-like domain-containing protein n=1 Tax=Candidatus Sulfurimonas marisnigri TaxID=2740405 RepID=A0A7S7RR77_9BACT|nr:rhodanese-like domain-containing protein [Candidatus Sulfurimonas marisnigri]QOY55245.1 rhodanese-like domain-containing protein [Candidatus Sulfurimonas marisnigri]